MDMNEESCYDNEKSFTILETLKKEAVMGFLVKNLSSGSVYIVVARMCKGCSLSVDEVLYQGWLSENSSYTDRGGTVELHLVDECTNESACAYSVPQSGEHISVQVDGVAVFFSAGVITCRR